MIVPLVISTFLLVAPKIEHFVFRDDYIEGQGLRQTCFVSQGDPPMLVSWFRDGVPGESSESVRITRIDEVTSLLAISDLSSHQAGNYSCVAKNEVAVVSVTASLVVRGNQHCTLCLHATLSAPAQLVKITTKKCQKSINQSQHEKLDS